MANKPTQPNFPLGLEADEQSKLAGILNTGTIEHGPDAVMTVPEGEDAPGLPSSVRYNPASDQFEGYYLSGGWLPLGGGGIRWEVLPYSPQSNLLEGRGYLVDNTDGISTVVLPPPDRVGDSVSICDAFGKFSTYPLTVSGGTYPVYGAVEDMTVSTDNMAATFTWTGTERGWVITSGVGLGQGRVYSRTIYTQILSADTTQITLSTAPAIVDVYVDGKRLLETKYSLDGNNVDFTPTLPSGSEVQIIEYTPIQLGSGGGGSGGGTVITWVYNGGSAVGGETEITLDVIVDSVSEIYIRGVRQQIGLGFTFDALTSKITLAEELEAGDEVVVVINGDPTIYNQIDRTLNEVARSNNIKNSEVIMSSDTSTVLDGKKVLYDSSAQKFYGIPTLPSGVRIVSVSNGKLTYAPGNIVVDLVNIPDTIDFSLPDGTDKVSYGEIDLTTRLNYEVYITGLDDTGNTSIVSKVQAAIDANPGKRLIIPAGDYLVDGTIFISRNTHLCGVSPIPTMYHDIVHNNGVEDIISGDGYTKLHLKGNPTKYILTDVVQGSDDAPKSFGIVFADSGAVLDDIAIIGWRVRTDGTFEPPSLTAANDAGATACFDVPVFNASVMSVRMHDTMIAGYIPENSACYWIDASRGPNRNGSGNTFNVNDRIKSVGANDSRQIDCCFWWFHPTTPATERADNFYAVKLQGHDDDIRNLTRYPSSSAAANAGASNWIWGGPGTSDHKFRGSVMKGVSLDNTIRSYVGDDRLNYFKTDIVGANNGYPGAWQNLTGAGGKISFNDCIIRHGDININRAAYVWFDNCYGEGGYFKMTNLTGYVTQSDGFLGHGAQDVTVNNADGSTPATYSRLTSPLYKVINCGNQDRFGLFYTSGSNAYARPHFDNKVSWGFDDGTTRLRWSNVHAVTVTASQITASTTNVVNFLKPPKIPSYTTALRPTLSAGDAGAMILDTTLGYQITWTGSAWKNGNGTIV